MEQQHMFTNRMIRNLLVPVVLEQILNSIMGTADTMMVSNVGSAALSAVSLVDSINVLLIQAFSALAAGGAIVCAQYIGQRNYEKAYHDHIAEKAAFLLFTHYRTPQILNISICLPCQVMQGLNKGYHFFHGNGNECFLSGHEKNLIRKNRYAHQPEKLADC